GLYDKFQQIFDGIQLDYAYNFSPQIQELAKIATASSAMQPVPDTARGYIEDMKALSQAALQYRDALKDNDKDEWLAIVSLLQKTTNENLEKYRILVGCYAHLYEITYRAGSTNEASDYQIKQKQAAFLAFKSAGRLNRAVTNVKV